MTRSIDGKPLRPDQAEGDLNLGAILQFAVGLIFVVAAGAGAMWWMSGFLRGVEEAKDPPPPVLREARERGEPPAPRLQIDPAGEMAALRAKEQAILENYAWENKAAGIARVPIERAMELMIQRANGESATSATSAETAETGDE